MPSIIGLVAHYHEVGLKGRNRNFFESTLTRNLKRALRGTGYARVRRGFGRVSVEFKPAARIDEAVERAARVFGIAYVGTGTRVAPDLDAIGGGGLGLVRLAPLGSFALSARGSSSLRQATELAEILTRFQLRTTLHLIPLADAQREIVTSAPSSLRVVLYRRAMMRIASALAEERNARALVTGDSLGQVASQTLENITTVDSSVPRAHVLRPLIGMDKQEIIELAERIGTFEISTRRYQDCCVLFEPRSPATRATVAEADAAEADLDIDAMVGKALAGRETRVLELPD